jgi:hypothetical protein
MVANPKIPIDAMAGAPGNDAKPQAVHLSLDVTDPEVVAELGRHPAGETRDTYALQALRLGVLALRMASGQVDATAVRDAGERLIGQMRETLATRADDLTKQVTSVLTRYFDPTTGAFDTRVRSLIQKDGEIERLLQQHLGGDSSTLARAMAAHVGESSPIFRMLSPTDSNGLRAQMESTLNAALEKQRDILLREFSLDTEASALSRLVAEIGAGSEKLQTDIQGKIDGVVKEFSLDSETSALSRLVGRVETAQRAITANLTLDEDTSALSRLKRELGATIDELSKKNADFHTEVRSTLVELRARKTEMDRSTRHGAEFEAELGNLLASLAQQQGDVHEATGTTTGIIKNCKVGDHVIELGPESAAPGVRIAWEAKESRACDLSAALAESETARKNRGAQLGVFVFSKKTAPDTLQPLARFGSNVVVVWDAEDPSSDLQVRAAYTICRALAIRERTASAQTRDVITQIEEATRAVEKQLAYLEEIKKQAETIQSNGEKIVIRAAKMRDDVAKEVERLDEQIAALKTGGG